VDESLQDVVISRLRAAGAHFAFLHGSRAAGTPRAGSDLDVAAWWEADPHPGSETTRRTRTTEAGSARISGSPVRTGSAAMRAVATANASEDFAEVDDVQQDLEAAARRAPHVTTHHLACRPLAAQEGEDGHASSTTPGIALDLGAVLGLEVRDGVTRGERAGDFGEPSRDGASAHRMERHPLAVALPSQPGSRPPAKLSTHGLRNDHLALRSEPGHRQRLGPPT
jgi:hypothetical protein